MVWGKSAQKCREQYVNALIVSHIRALLIDAGTARIKRVRGRVYSVSTGPVVFADVVCALEIFTDITKEYNLKDKLMEANSRMMRDLEIARSFAVVYIASQSAGDGQIQLLCRVFAV